MNETKGPRRRPEIAARTLGGETLLYDDQGRKIHVLSGVAGFVWELCDGSHALSEIESRIREAYEVPPGSDVRADLDAVLEDLARLDLLVTAPEGVSG